MGKRRKVRKQRRQTAKVLQKMDPTLTRSQALIKTFPKSQQKKKAKSLKGAKIAGAVGLGAGALLAFPAAVATGATALAKKIASKPLLSLAGAGLLSTKQGRGLAQQTGRAIFTGGKNIPIAIDKAKDTGNVKDLLKTAGVLGAGIGIATAGKQIIEKIRENRIEKHTFQTNTEIPPTPQFETIGTAQPDEAQAPTQAMPTINNKISVKPTIKVSVNNSKRFINQQNKIYP